MNGASNHEITTLLASAHIPYSEVRNICQTFTVDISPVNKYKVEGPRVLALDHLLI